MICLLRFANGTNNCDTFAGDPLLLEKLQMKVMQLALQLQVYAHLETIKYVTNNYTNMALRTIEGMDIGIYYDIQTDYGDFDLRYIGTFLDKFEQKASGEFADYKQKR